VYGKKKKYLKRKGATQKRKNIKGKMQKKGGGKNAKKKLEIRQKE
jgi:hypothetical protein